MRFLPIVLLGLLGQYVDHSSRARFTEVFTQYRIKATMGTLLKSQGVIAPMAAAPLDEVKANVSLPGLN